MIKIYDPREEDIEFKVKNLRAGLEDIYNELKDENTTKERTDDLLFELKEYLKQIEELVGLLK